MDPRSLSIAKLMLPTKFVMSSRRRSVGVCLAMPTLCRADRWMRLTGTSAQPPYRSVGPVSVEEYESRAERYDKQMKEDIGVDPTGKTTEEKVAITREYREERYQKLVDAVYKRRGWTTAGVPTMAKVKELGIDFPEVVQVVRRFGG